MTVPALIATGAVPRFLDSIRKTGVPPKVDTSYLKGIGFMNNNDRALIPLFKSLGFLDAGGKPTDKFRAYRAAGPEDAKKVLGTAIKACYAGLFEIYPDAYRKDDEALMNWIRANTESGEATQTRALKTFKTLCESAIFDQSKESHIPVSPAAAPMPNGHIQEANLPSTIQQVAFRATPEVSINITLQIAASNDASIYDKFFAAMKRHLFPDES
jgi:hypothetical protein